MNFTIEASGITVGALVKMLEVYDLDGIILDGPVIRGHTVNPISISTEHLLERMRDET